MLASQETLAEIKTALVAGPAGGATAAKQDTGNGSLATIATANAPSGAPVFPAQVSVGGTGGTNATQFGAQAAAIGVYVQALSTNTVSVFLGTSDVAAAKGFELTPGQVQFFPVSNANLFYHITTTTGQKVNLLVL
jgi:hypothetical protein